MVNECLLSIKGWNASVMTPDHAMTIALLALGYILEDTSRAERFLALTGLTPDDLRSSVAEPATQAAILDFLLAHEPDLLACAHSLALKPDDLVRARAVFSPQERNEP
jgi:Protein of unknown function (DUF3572)